MKHHRNVMGSSFEDTVDELEEKDFGGLDNLADCMLVLVCGLMVAFLVHYNVFDTTTMNQMEVNGEKIIVDSDPSKAGESEEADSESSYKKLGMLYQDEKTGKMYYLQEDSGESE